jgi:hypothetical protein
MVVSFLGFVTDILQVRISHTVPITGMGTYCTIICMVSDETHGIPFTCGILIMKIMKITIIITLLQYFTKNKRGGYHEMAATHTH